MYCRTSSDSRSGGLQSTIGTVLGRGAEMRLRPIKLKLKLCHGSLERLKVFGVGRDGCN